MGVFPTKPGLFSTASNSILCQQIRHRFFRKVNYDNFSMTFLYYWQRKSYLSSNCTCQLCCHALHHLYFLRSNWLMASLSLYSHNACKSYSVKCNYYYHRLRLLLLPYSHYLLSIYQLYLYSSSHI